MFNEVNLATFDDKRLLKLGKKRQKDKWTHFHRATSPVVATSETQPECPPLGRPRVLVSRALTERRGFQNESYSFLMGGFWKVADLLSQGALEEKNKIYIYIYIYTYIDIWEPRPKFPTVCLLPPPPVLSKNGQSWCTNLCNKVSSFV